MIAVPLYLSDVLAPDSFEAAIMVIQLIKAFVGIAIAVIAYRGYRNNESRPMLFLAIGFILVLGVPFILYIVGVTVLVLAGLTESAQAVVIALAEVSQVAGLLAIVYALRM